MNFSDFSNGNSFDLDGRRVRTLPWVFRVHVPGWRECGQR